jgi:hypothetical protein
VLLCCVKPTNKKKCKKIKSSKEPITQILGVREGDLTGEIFINMGSTINLTCIVRNLPEPSSIYWTHNGEVSYMKKERCGRGEMIFTG